MRASVWISRSPKVARSSSHFYRTHNAGFATHRLRSVLYTRRCSCAVWGSKNADCVTTSRQLDHSFVFYSIVLHECAVMLIVAYFADDCPRDQNRSYSGNFSSPHYPINYPKKKKCTWGITVPGDNRILVTFDEFNTQRNSDVLKIYDGASNSSDVLAILSGDWSGSTYGSSGPSLWFEFTTDGSITAKGFHATYTVTQQSSTYRPDSHFIPSRRLESFPLAGVIFEGTVFVSFFCTI